MNSKVYSYNIEEIDKIEDIGKLFLILVNILKKLRSPQGCMWDREQDHSSLKRSLLEEAYEVLESIENNNIDELREELGDLLLQVIFHSQIASENNKFTIAEVIKSIIKKLIRRHPHVFEGKDLKNCKEILANWEYIKKKERKENQKKSDSIYSNIPKILPSLHYAYEIQNRASRLGFDWDSPEGVFEKINEEIEELKRETGSFKNYIKDKKENGSALKKVDRIKDEIGDILFSIVNFSRHIGIDCEESLKSTCKKFIERFNFMEKYAEENNMDFKKLSLNEKDKLWEIAKEKIS